VPYLILIILILLLLYGSKRLPQMGEQLGRKARKPYRQARWLWSSATGTEEDSIRAEREYGRECAHEFIKQFPGEVPSRDQELAESVGKKLAEAVNERRLEFRFAAVVSETANAYALPGGFVFITRALLKLAGHDRDVVAFFLGHEIAHVVKGHAKDQLTAQTLLHAVSARLSGTGLMLRQLLEKGYSRTLEQEADREAVRLAKAAGFDAEASIRALENLGRIAPDHSGLAEYFSTHPAFTERIRDLEEQIARNRV
jgi:predicted Zn-dependent protease